MVVTVHLVYAAVRWMLQEECQSCNFHNLNIWISKDSHCNWFINRTAKEKPPINVVGDVGGRIAIMVDDMIDDVRSFVAAAEVLKDRGAYKIYVMATHGLLSSDAPRLIEDSPIDEVVVTNTIPHEIQKMQCHKIKTVDISVLLAEAIRRIHNKESMSYLFRNVTLEDWKLRLLKNT